nr:putative DnaK suppressor protein [uncultured bacterium]
MVEGKRYSEKELALFKVLIEQKLEKAKDDLEFLLGQIQDISENAGDEGGDWMEDTSNYDLEMLHTMAHRHRRHIQDLNNALIRIHNKNYGICMITGELIDIKRLMAVPTTTKSLAAKNGELNPVKVKKPINKVDYVGDPKAPKIISKIVARSGHIPTPSPVIEEEIDELEEDEFYDDLEFIGGEDSDSEDIEFTE